MQRKATSAAAHCCRLSARGKVDAKGARVTWVMQQLLSASFHRDANLLALRKASRACFYVYFCFALKAFDFIFKPAVFIVLKMIVFC